MGGYDVDDDDERDLQATKDELARLSTWEDYEESERNEHDHIDWSSFPIPGQDNNTTSGKKEGGGRPYTPAANAVCAARRIPHYKNWKKTDPYQGNSNPCHSSFSCCYPPNYLLLLSVIIKLLCDYFCFSTFYAMSILSLCIKELLQKRYKISTKYFTSSRDEYGLFGKGML